MPKNKHKTKKNTTNDKKRYKQNKHCNRIFGLTDEQLFKKKQQNTYSSSDDEDDDDPFGIMDDYLNGTTGCPYEDEYIKIHGGTSSVLIGDTYCYYHYSKIIPTKYKTTKFKDNKLP